jgi:sensor histidine kinase YesM
LLQPFIENAIWHGIVAPDVSNGVIQLSVKIIEGRVHYFIEDNGIGRRKSVVENSTLHSGSRSIGIELTMNRLKMADPSAAIQIIDKENDTGTIVHINHILKV